MKFVSSLLVYAKTHFLMNILGSSTVEIKPITEPIQHGEGPFWDSTNNILYYVDTFKASAFRLDLNTGISTFYKLGRDSIAVIIPTAENQDEFIVGADRFLYKLSWPRNNQHLKLTELFMIEAEKPQNQFNDGKVDSKGRLWLGTLMRNKDLSVTPEGGSLYMFKGKDLHKYEEKIPKTSISNGLAWSRDGKRFYFVDTEPRQVFGYDYNEEIGKIGAKRIVFDMKNHPDLKGSPDGMTIDTNDNLWIALFGGHSIINVDPRTSTLITVVRMPVTYLTSVCFGGPQLDVLYVTSSRLHLNETQVKEQPLAGSVFSVRHLGVRGFPAHKVHTAV